MKVLTSQNKLQSNVNTKSQSFGIGDMSIVINLLTNLYSKPKQTLTQEYLCNARDANRESGSTKPIQVYCPTTFKPLLRIRDFGPGLSPDRIANIFLYYGKSTKSDSNEQTGGFGIGGKSAWAYTDSFIIHSYYNGVKYTYAAIKAENKPSLELIEKVKTKESNGVCIEIAVSNQDVRAFQDAVKRSVMYWSDSEKPEVFNLSEEIEPVNFIKEINGHYLQKGKKYYYNEYTIVIDGIPYVINQDELDTFRNINCDITLNNIPVGVVTIAPNREELIYDKRTIAFIDKEVKALMKKAKEQLHREKTDCKSLREYINWFLTAEEARILDVDFSYEGYTRGYGSPLSKGNKSVTDCMRYCKLTDDDRIIKKTANGYSRRQIISWDLRSIDNTVFIDVNESALEVNKRLRTYFDTTGKSECFIIAPEGVEFAKDLEVTNLSDFEPKVMPKMTSSRSKTQPLSNKEIVMWRYHSSRYRMDLLTDRTIVYLPLQDKESKGNLRDQVKDLFFLSDTNIKMVSSLPNFIHFDEWVKKQSLSEANKRRLYTDYVLEFCPILNSIVGLGTLKSKALNDTLRACKRANDRNSLESLNDAYTSSKEFKKLSDKLDKLESKLTNSCELLPLLGSWDITQNKAKVIKYINSNFK